MAHPSMTHVRICCKRFCVSGSVLGVVVNLRPAQNQKAVAVTLIHSPPLPPLCFRSSLHIQDSSHSQTRHDYTRRDTTMDRLNAYLLCSLLHPPGTTNEGHAARTTAVLVSVCRSCALSCHVMSCRVMSHLCKTRPCRVLTLRVLFFSICKGQR